MPPNNPVAADPRLVPAFPKLNQPLPPPPDPGDIESPIPDSILAEGRAIVQADEARQTNNDILRSVVAEETENIDRIMAQYAVAPLALDDTQESRQDKLKAKVQEKRDSAVRRGDII